ncbi:MAG: hypothetical protein A2909_01235 [Candidatus Tagabacteria bacterium RIFCSPLOWO2_01_FULL_39_11]|uniref:Uncharacterized protein n=1 Tax=Candidatus Tagabacteria bacterium RIFCSPLOWO2_01_FULL_39_11 TaxID=1802295 RepID=A0A1G2LUC8_9BACT|nr:MAG: hypothetical protein A2909_01235 [Candidatus Tagabacteria bacterium RIFCSPLOWO2_01_FULL_39_11]
MKVYFHFVRTAQLPGFIFKRASEMGKRSFHISEPRRKKSIYKFYFPASPCAGYIWGAWLRPRGLNPFNFVI